MHHQRVTPTNAGQLDGEINKNHDLPGRLRTPRDVRTVLWRRATIGVIISQPSIHVEARGPDAGNWQHERVKTVCAIEQ
jgi:hypothetical protein